MDLGKRFHIDKQCCLIAKNNAGLHITKQEQSIVLRVAGLLDDTGLVLT